MATTELPDRDVHQVSFVTGDVTEDGCGILLHVQAERDGAIVA